MIPVLSYPSCRARRAASVMLYPSDCACRVAPVMLRPSCGACHAPPVMLEPQRCARHVTPVMTTAHKIRTNNRNAPGVTGGSADPWRLAALGPSQPLVPLRRHPLVRQEEIEISRLLIVAEMLQPSCRARPDYCPENSRRLKNHPSDHGRPTAQSLVIRRAQSNSSK